MQADEFQQVCALCERRNRYFECLYMHAIKVESFDSKHSPSQTAQLSVPHFLCLHTRIVFKINMTLDYAVVLSIAVTYREVRCLLIHLGHEICQRSLSAFCLLN